MLADSQASPIAIISDMRREFLSELKHLKSKESLHQDEITFLKQELNLLRLPNPTPLPTQSNNTVNQTTRFHQDTNTPMESTPLTSNVRTPPTPSTTNVPTIPSTLHSAPSMPRHNALPLIPHSTNPPPQIVHQPAPPTSTPHPFPTYTNPSPSTHMPSPHASQGVSPDMISLLQTLKPTPNFTNPSYDPKDGKNWLNHVIGLLAGSDYFSILLSPDKLSLIDICPPSGTSANTTLYTRLTKSLTKEQLTILTGDHTDPSSLASGLSILHCIDSAMNIELTTAQARKKMD